MASLDRTRTVTITRAQEIFFGWTTDVLIYIVVLNLIVEYADAVVIDSFTISILTAILLKILLDVVMHYEHGVREFFDGKEGTVYRVLGVVSLVAVLFLGKLVILESVDVVFGDHVELGHFIEVVFIVVALIAAQRLFGVFFKWLGEPANTTADDNEAA